MKKIIFILTSVFLWAACDEKPTGADFSKNLLDNYMHVESMTLDYRPTYLEKGFLVVFDGQTIGKSDPRYKKLSKYYGDTHYNRKKIPGDHALSQPLTSIDIICDKDIAGHAAGTSLADIFIFSAGTYYRYIKSGYSSKVSKSVYKSIPELVPDDLELIEYFWEPALTLNADNILPGDYTFRVTIANESDVFTADITLTL